MVCISKQYSIMCLHETNPPNAPLIKTHFLIGFHFLNAHLVCTQTFEEKTNTPIGSLSRRQAPVFHKCITTLATSTEPTNSNLTQQLRIRQQHSTPSLGFGLLNFHQQSGQRRI